MPLFRSPARPRLSVQPLEGRLVPNGTVLASLSPTGALTLIGDDDANVVTVKVTATGVTLTPDGNTQINTANFGDPVDLGPVKSIRADLRGGADELSIDGAEDFRVPGRVVLGLGDGDNTLSLATTGTIALGGLKVIAGDGADSAVIQGAAGSTVGGTARLTFGDGGVAASLGDVTFKALSVVAGDAIGNPNTLTATGVTVTKTVSAAMGSSFPATVDFAGSVVGNLKVTGYSVSSVLQSTVVRGNLAMKTGYSVGLVADGLTVVKNAALSGPNANLTTTGAATTINGNLALAGPAWTSTSFQSDDLTEVKGNLTVRGGWFNDLFETNANFRASKNVTLLLGGGDNEVTVGDGLTRATVRGKLTVKTGNGSDLVTFDGATVSGPTSLSLGGGFDVLTIDGGSTFDQTFKADLGAGDDLIDIASSIGSSQAVRFSGKATILAGAGNDLLFLGLDPGAGGDANSKVEFATPGSVIDGGTGLNEFDEFTSQYTGVIPSNW